MDIFNKKQSIKTLDRVIIFAHDESQKFYAETQYVLAIEDGRIITENADLVLPYEDAKPFSTKEGILYAYNVSLEYLKEVQHLAEVEKNIIVQQAFLYPGRGFDSAKSNLNNLIIIGALSLITIISLFV
jgi:hypothetical protein